MIAYYAEQAAAHAARNPMDPTAQQQAAEWQAQIVEERRLRPVLPPRGPRAAWRRLRQSSPHTFGLLIRAGVRSLVRGSGARLDRPGKIRSSP